MMNFAALTLTEFLPILATIASMLAAFYALLNKVLRSQENERNADREERKLFAEAINDMKDASIRVAEATEKAAKEAEQRNGHLADISIQNKDAIIQAVQAVTLNQNVKEQHVDKQIVDKKE